MIPFYWKPNIPFFATVGLFNQQLFEVWLSKIEQEKIVINNLLRNGFCIKYHRFMN